MFISTLAISAYVDYEQNVFFKCNCIYYFIGAELALLVDSSYPNVFDFGILPLNEVDTY
ncbi:MAG: hypothetical protein CM1200mP11_0920 [Nitrosopumilaceae archaeon]|nr:MAG: hypothetical protein CM1200mP11_0920 [Nitrosopumilaceae archaeon]